MEDQQVISGMSAVSVLSVPWVLDKILPGLSKAPRLPPEPRRRTHGPSAPGRLALRQDLIGSAGVGE